MDDAKVLIDTIAYPVGWGIRIGLRKAGIRSLKNTQELADWLISKGIPKEDIIKDQNNIVYSKDFKNTDETALHLQDLLDRF